MAEKDKWIVKCPKCGRIGRSCQHVSRQDVERIVQLLKAGVEVYESEEEMEHFEDHVHERPDRGRLYHLIQPRFSLEDVVMAPKTREAIEDALVELRHKGVIFQRWGMRKVIRKNKGISLLFAGPPGTGKTMTAEAIARALKKPLMIVNYAQLENMWVGETEKNIEAVFEDAAKRDAVLFFDEADAVFHRRGMTIAPWTNRDVNVLLNQVENAPGVCILATNLARVMDRALDRRIDIAVEFEIPDLEMRKRIWRKLVPKEAPLADNVDLDALAKKYTLSGGAILNVVRQSMRNALKRGRRHRITQEDLINAAEREVKKSDVMSRDHMSQWKVEPRQRLGGYA
jgi:SpoVK/Ycf46/Vps4 family AAA+-type ATPase